jgi:hypothetical protein
MQCTLSIIIPSIGQIALGVERVADVHWLLRVKIIGIGGEHYSITVENLQTGVISTELKE